MLKKQVSVCALPSKKTKSGLSGSKTMRPRRYRWSGVKTEQYKSPDGSWRAVIRQSLIGTSGEKTKFHLRYFEIAPGGYTTFERHRHEHVVIGVRGKGRCKIGRKSSLVKCHDVIYIAPNEPHQLFNPYSEPFGFFCIVDAKRDRPKVLKAGQ